MTKTIDRATVWAALAIGACSAAQPTVDAATCSPKADAWHRHELATVCAGKLIPQECPEAEAIGDEYRRRENAECSNTP